MKKTSNIKIKVCGMRHPDNIRELIKIHPDYIGFIFYEGSPRFAGNMLNQDTIKLIPKSIKKTGVFVNHTLKQVEDTISRFNLNVVQLHGNEPPALCHTLMKEGIEVIKALPLKKASDLDQTFLYRDACHYFLFDTPTSEYGGSGRKFDWTLLRKKQLPLPYFLSGGITEQDASTLFGQLPIMPYAIDINSKFEIQPGIKDIESIERFTKIIQTTPEAGPKNSKIN